MDILLNPISRDERQIQAERQWRWIGSIVKRKGLKVFRMTSTGEVWFAAMKEHASVITPTLDNRGTYTGKTKVLKRFSIQYEPGAHYLQALNLKTAMAKLKKLQTQGLIDGSINVRIHDPGDNRNKECQKTASLCSG